MGFRGRGTVCRACRKWWGCKLPGNTSAVSGRRRGNEGSGGHGRCFTGCISFIVTAPREGVARGAGWSLHQVKLNANIFAKKVNPSCTDNRQKMVNCDLAANGITAEIERVPIVHAMILDAEHHKFIVNSLANYELAANELKTNMVALKKAKIPKKLLAVIHYKTSGKVGSI